MRISANFEQVLRLLRTSSPPAENKFKTCREQVHFSGRGFSLTESWSNRDCGGIGNGNCWVDYIGVIGWGVKFLPQRAQSLWGIEKLGDKPKSL